MNTLGKRPDQEEQTNFNNYDIPAVVRNDSDEISLEKALIISVIAHPLFVGLIWLILFILPFLGIHLDLFKKPVPKMRDIEFVLVNKPEQTPINPKTKYRADRNSRAGGKHNPNLPVSEPEPVSRRSVAQTESAPAAKPVHKTVRKQKSRPARSQQHAIDTPVPPRPVPHQAFPKPVMPRPNAFSIPVPSSKMPKAVTPSGGPVTSGPTGGDYSPSSSPAPVMSGTGGTGSSSGKGRYSSGRSLGSGNPGNPGAGNPNGSPGIDAVREPDFGPYMRELQRRIKRNWDPPRGNESKRVVLLFRISKDGRLLSVQVYKSSGVAEADRAAISAVQLSAPFRPLPPEYRESSVPIEFTFDYNVFGGASGRIR